MRAAAALFLLTLAALAAAAPAGPQTEPRRAVIEVLEAEYGSPQTRMDLRERLQARVRDGRLDVRVDNRLAGGDPARGEPKQLRVKVRVDGELRELTLNEGRRLRLP